MAESLTKQQFTDALEASIQRYEDILVLFKSINNNLEDKSTASLPTKGTVIFQLQEKATLADQELISTLKKMDTTISTHFSAHQLINRRQELIGQILTQNRSLLSVVKNIKSLLTHEIQQIQGGRTALKGYHKTTSSQNKTIVNHAR